MAALNFYGSDIYHSLSPQARKEAMVRIVVAHQKTGQLLKALQNAKNSDKYNERLAAFISSQDVLLTAAIRANAKISPRRRATLECCLALPSKLNISSPLSEPVLVKAEPKKSGGFRPICVFGLQHRTAQDIITRIMELHFKPKPFQYTYRGVDKAIAAVKSAVDKGQVSAALFDISNFFGSFECSELANELPLQKEAVNSVVVGRQMAVELMKAGGGHTCALPSLSLTTLLWQARQGLPQGSSTSPIIAAYILARLAWNASTQVVLVNYADDFILLAVSEAALEPEIGKLQDAVAQLPGGHFKLRLIEKRHLSKGVDFLGHHLELVNGQLRTTPTDGNWEAALSVNNEIETKLLHFKPGKAHKHKDLIALAKVQAHTDGWVAAFKECDNIAELKEFLQTTIAQTADAIGVTLAQVKAAVDPSMTYRDKGYALKI